MKQSRLKPRALSKVAAASVSLLNDALTLIRPILNACRQAAAYTSSMTKPDLPWETRVADLWKILSSCTPEDFIARIDSLIAELPAGSAIGLFERGAAQDSTGHSDCAVPLYRAALETGLEGPRRRRAIIQLASSLRNLGEPGQAAALLTTELDSPGDELDGAVRAFLALALVDLGREREAVAVSLTALSRYLPRYNQSLARYVKAL